MSIMIKDMEMPDSCYDCRMRTDSDFCSAMPKEFCGYTDDIKRPDWCPLIELPSAEPERKKGKWIDSRDVCWLCSECGKWLDVLQGNVDMNFCPNCGADMRGEQR